MALYDLVVMKAFLCSLPLPLRLNSKEICLRKSSFKIFFVALSTDMGLPIARNQETWNFKHNFNHDTIFIYFYILTNSCWKGFSNKELSSSSNSNILLIGMSGIGKLGSCLSASCLKTFSLRNSMLDNAFARFFKKAFSNLKNWIKIHLNK